MINCNKRQKEVHKEIEQYRCIEKKASTYLQVVDVPTCEACPVLLAKTPKPCRSKERISIIKQDLNYASLCPQRWDEVCQITGQRINPEICLACDQETADHMATLPEMGAGFASEVRRWIREGRPVRTDEEVAERLEICQGNTDKGIPQCKLYNQKKQACNKCGCAMNDSSWPLLNGIRMSTKICPMGLWK